MLLQAPEGGEYLLAELGQHRALGKHGKGRINVGGVAWQGEDEEWGRW